MNDEQGSDVLDELRELRRRVAELEAQVASRPAQAAPEERSTRRGMLRLAGAAVAGGAAATIVGTQPAAATSGTMFYGTTNNAVTSPTTLSSTAAAPTLTLSNTHPDSALYATSTGSGSVIIGEVTSPNVDGYGVHGLVTGSVGLGLVGSGGHAQLFLAPLGYTDTEAPSGGFHHSGEIVCNAGGFFACVETGTPGAWRALASTTTAGALYPLTPTRVYDSRAAVPAPGVMVAGSNRTITVAHGRDASGAVTTFDLVPPGATAVAANVTVTGTTGGGGYLSVNPGGNTSAASSTINWFGAGQNIANGVTLTLNASRELTIVCGVGGGNTHVIVDIAGYYI